MSGEELKPCPFCGGEVSFHKDEECPGCHLIQCGQCRAYFDFATGADPGNDCETVDALRAAITPMWNTRTLPHPASLGTVRPLGYLNKKDIARLQDEVPWEGTYLTVGVDHWAQWQEDTPYDHLQAIYTHPTHQGEAVEVVAYMEENGRLWNDTTHPGRMTQLMTVAQHQHILAGMRQQLAELDQAREEIEGMHKSLDKLRAQCAGFSAYAEIDRLTAELAAIKGQEVE